NRVNNIESLTEEDKYQFV
ncbi:unnamed protein product, partial [Onchocerca ochengi]